MARVATIGGRVATGGPGRIGKPTTGVAAGGGGGGSTPTAAYAEARGLWNHYFYTHAADGTLNDVGSAGVDPWLHYLTDGAAENRNASPILNTAATKAALGITTNPVLHILANGGTPTPMSGLGAATKFVLVAPDGPTKVGEAATIQARPLDGTWPAGTSIAVTCDGVAGTASGAITPTAGTVATASCTFTPSAGGYGLLTGTASGLTCVDKQGLIAVAQGSVLPTLSFKGRTGGHAAGDVLEAGMAFGKGHVPAGAVLQIGSTPVAVHPISTWPDGSCKVGRLRVALPSSLAAGATWGGTLTTGGTLSGTPPVLSGLPAISLSITPSGGGAAWTWDIKAAVLATGPGATTQRRTQGRFVNNPLARGVRVVSTVPSAKCGSTGMAVVVDVELRSDGTCWVEPWFRNETSDVGATMAAYTAVLVQDGVTVINRTITNQHPYLSWGRLTGTKAGALATRPAMLRPSLLVAYLADHGFLPRIDTANPVPSSTLTGFASDMAQGWWHIPFVNRNSDLSSTNIKLGMPDVSARPDIGIVTGNQGAWLASDDQRAEDYCLAQAEDGGGIPWHTLDASADGGSGVYWRQAEHPGGGANGNYPSNKRPSPLSESAPNGWEINMAHVPSLAYVPFLLTGREALRDEVMAEGSAAILYLAPENGTVDGLIQYWNGASTRAKAWVYRSVYYSTICAATGSTDEAYFGPVLGLNMDYMLSSRAFLKGRQGEVYGYFGDRGMTDQVDHMANYMQQYDWIAVGMSAKQDARALAYLHTFGAHHILAGFGRSDFTPVNFTAIDLNIRPLGGSGPLLTTYAAIGAQHATRSDPGEWADVQANGFGWGSSGVFIDVFMAAIAGFADLGIDTALECWRLATGAAGDPKFKTGPANSASHVVGAMQWSIVPKAPGGTVQVRV